jgi:hypothetical protein
MQHMHTFGGNKHIYVVQSGGFELGGGFRAFNLNKLKHVMTRGIDIHNVSSLQTDVFTTLIRLNPLVITT